MNNNVVDLKVDKKNIGFAVQIIVVLIMTIIGIISIFVNTLVPYFFLSLSINMIVLTINNYLFIKRKYALFIYLACAIYTFIIFLQGIL